ncbi:LPXTG cell wall anchor domain-containing protein [Listeria booriae]|uniref:LPXTG cell wall anchor domain-containing protein n=1 Tax=Listeria booriae TaxID=1552123 RepID=UPI001626AC00|nr:LPXTG cell wall anchor domain-containing protein [Listeria booriae]MBC2149801.1 LPXTG cell wall anchor domain-containing protein [Listeria booriae]
MKNKLVQIFMLMAITIQTICTPMSVFAQEQTALPSIAFVTQETQESQEDSSTQSKDVPSIPERFYKEPPAEIVSTENAKANDSPKEEWTVAQLLERPNPYSITGLTDTQIKELGQALFETQAASDPKLQISIQNDAGKTIVIPFKSVRANATSDNRYTDITYSHNFQGWDVSSYIVEYKVDKAIAFCIDPMRTMLDGNYNESTKFPFSESVLNEVNYIGALYSTVGTDKYTYATAQLMIWEKIGAKNIQTNIPSYAAIKDKINNAVISYKKVPSFAGETINLTVGKSITLVDTNDVLNQYIKVNANTANISYTKTGNQLTLTPNMTSQNGNLEFWKINQLSTPMVYYRDNAQTLATFNLKDTSSFSLSIKVQKNGNGKIIKKSAETGRPLQGAVYSISNNKNDQVETVTTGADGQLLTKSYEHGTVLTIKEISAPAQHSLNSQAQTITIEAGKTKEVTFTNQLVKGYATITKTGDFVTTLKEEKTLFGLLYNFVYEPKGTIKNTTFDIFANEDIVGIDGTHFFTKGEKVDTITTNQDGEAKTKALYIGKYYAKESKVETGFTLDATPIPFEITYKDQNVPLTQTKINVINHWQSIHVTVHKEEEVANGFKDNHVVITSIPSNGKTFGLFTAEEIKQSDNISLPKDTLVGIAKTKDGKADFGSKQLPLSTYYVQELQTDDSHVLDTTKYPVDYSGDNSTQVEANVYANATRIGMKQNTLRIVDKPLINKLFLTDVSFKKVNEIPSFDKNNALHYTKTEAGAGAQFELLNENRQVIQTTTINKNGIGSWEKLPTGTYYQRETATSSNNYVLSKEEVKLIVTKDGTTAFDSKNQPLRKETNKNFLFTLKNEYIKGDAELKKTDVSTGEALPNTGINITDEQGTILISGRTNEDGVFIFKNLPKGRYTFVEYDAPKGYLIDETPIPFEIKENGEIVRCKMTNQKQAITTISSKEKTLLGSLPQTGEETQPFLVFIGFIIIGSLTFFHYKKKKQAKSDKKSE